MTISQSPVGRGQQTANGHIIMEENITRDLVEKWWHHNKANAMFLGL